MNMYDSSMQPLSIVVPVYNEAQNIPLLYSALNNSHVEFTELIFVDDGSIDSSLNAIADLASGDSRVKAISFSRNFGHQAALIAGLHAVHGSWILIMDGDLQHPPEVIPQMITAAKQGYDMVSARRIETRKAGPLKQWTSSMYYRLLNFIADTHIEKDVADFRLFNEKILQSILQFEERELFVRGIFSWIGFRTTTVAYQAPPRQHGKSKYSWPSMMSLGIKGAISFSFKPLRISLLIGTIVSLIAFAMGIYSIVAHYKGNTLPGWTSIITAVMFMGGVQLLVLGLIGEYIASMFKEIKKRPLFIIDKKINL